MAKQRSGVTARGIGFELERHRKAARLNLQDVGAGLGVSASTISRLENGKRDPSVEEVASILAIIGVTGDERERLIEQARGGNGFGLMGASLGAPNLMYQDLEKRATSILNFELILIPGLVQTADYARAVISALQFHEADSEIEARVAHRLARQAILTRKKLPKLDFILTEEALRRPLGGPRVMAAQVQRLIELTERPEITIRIIPAEVVTHPGLTGSFVIMSFSDDPTVAYIESRASGMFLDDPRQVHFHKLTTEKLLEVALNVPESIELMTTIGHELHRE